MTASYLALGDSYTIGEGVAPSERWPVQLASAVRSQGVPIDDPTIVARTGWTTAELLDALDALPDDHPRDFAMVSLLVGVNDQYRGLGVSAFGDGFDRLLARAIRFAGGDAARVLVASIPDWSVTPFAEQDHRSGGAIAREIDEFNGAARARTLASHARFVDITSISRRAGGEPELLANDRLHPSGLMYREWVRIVLPHAIAILRS